MSLVVNFLTGDTAELLQSSGTWYVSSGGASLTPTQERIKHSNIGSLLVEKSGFSPVEIKPYKISYLTNNYFNSRLLGATWVWSELDIEVTSKFIINDALTTTQRVGTQSVYAQRWTLVSLFEEQPSIKYANETVTIDYSLKFSDAGGASLTASKIFITSPVVTMPDIIERNLFLNEVYNTLPEYISVADGAVENQNSPLKRFLEPVFMEANDLYYLWFRLKYVAPNSVEQQKDSDLFNWETADENWLPWLGMLLGIKFSNYATGFSSWSSLETKLDTDGNLSSSAEWSEWETLPDTADAGTDVSWAEIELYAPDTVDILETIRWQVKTAIYGIKAGTTEALIEAAKFKLKGPTYTVRVETNFGNDPWHIRVYTPAVGTPDTTGVNQESGTILAFLAPTIPAGYQVSHRTE